MIIERPVGACANAICPNRAHEGPMATLTFTSDDVISRPVVLVLCANCATTILDDTATGAQERA